jgi:hypothetical protein
MGASRRKSIPLIFPMQYFIYCIDILVTQEYTAKGDASASSFGFG